MALSVHKATLTAVGAMLRRLARDRAGNTLMLVSAALLPLLAMVGGSFDMGRAYLVQSRLQQACDAGALAARKRLGPEAARLGSLPDEADAIGQRFFLTNFPDAYYGTADSRFAMHLSADYAVQGDAAVTLPTQIMSVFGFEDIDIAVECSAQINFTNTDIMMVLDVTGSMGGTNPGDPAPRIDILKDTVREFHAQLEAASAAGSRVRYGFLPYSTNVNVGHLLKDEWVVTQWGYQSREMRVTDGIGTRSYYTPAVTTEGSVDPPVVVQTYRARLSNGRPSCPSRPADTAAVDAWVIATVETPFAGPPAGTRTVTTYARSRNGDVHTTSVDGTQTCIVQRTTYRNHVETYDYVTEPASTNGQWLYDRYLFDVSDWRNTGTGCMEERQTYPITDYDNVDLSRALDLNLDLVPTDDPAAAGVTVTENLRVRVREENDDADRDDDDRDDRFIRLPAGSATKWRPSMPAVIYARELEWNFRGGFQSRPKATKRNYVMPMLLGTAACPAPAQGLATMDRGQLDAYLDTLRPAGSTYHDIGMIWGGRLISPTGPFAEEEGPGAGHVKRNLIFLTDGETAPMDLSYGTYGIEPIDGRRWTPSSPFTLTQVVENRFSFACKEVKKRGVTVWVIGFGTGLSDILKDCAGEGRYFEAANAAELNASFATIARSVSDLRLVE